MELLSFADSKPLFGEQVASLAADIVVGFLAIAIVFPICLFVPGAFMTWEPWVVIAAAALFSAGLIRGANPPLNRWLKAARIAVGASILTIAWLGQANEWLFTAAVVSSLIIPTVAGVSFRRRKG